MARPLIQPRSGGAIMELALLLPVLIMLSMGVAEYGYFIYAKNVLQQAAHAGARVAIQTNATDAGVKAEVDAAMLAAGFQSTGYTVTTNPSSVLTISTGTTTSVTVSCTWGSFGVHPLPTSMGGIDPSRTVVAAATMSRE